MKFLESFDFEDFLLLITLGLEFNIVLSKLNFDVLYMINQELRPFNTYSRFYHNLDFAYGSSHRSGFLKQLELYSERLEANRRAQLG